MKSTLSVKDLLYIEDAFSWNLELCKKVKLYISITRDKEIIKILNTLYEKHIKICNNLVLLLGGSNE
ncbi:MAG: hypothetical protein RR228_01790 [Bacilli bacterium]